MCVGPLAAPKTPKVPAPAAAPPPAPNVSGQASTSAGDEERRRRALAGGRRSTILTGPQGTGSAGGQGKQLLGQ